MTEYVWTLSFSWEIGGAQNEPKFTTAAYLGRDFMRELSWLQTLGWLLTRLWEEDDSVCSVSHKKTSSGPIWNTAATVRKHHHWGIMIACLWLRFPSCLPQVSIWSCGSFTYIYIYQTTAANSNSLASLGFKFCSCFSDSSLLLLHRHHPWGFPGVQHSARCWFTLKSGE